MTTSFQIRLFSLAFSFTVLAACSVGSPPSTESMSLNNSGLRYMQADDDREAELCFEKALALEPGLAIAHLNLGALYQKTGQLQKAREQYQLAISNGDTAVGKDPTADPKTDPSLETVGGIARHKIVELPALENQK